MRFKDMKRLHDWIRKEIEWENVACNARANKHDKRLEFNPDILFGFT